ncbi:hypothetical protein MKK63_07125 [Methylobacterium sp. J-088]|uniref:hypothetical protein n=1 Tax=Methylobacterium sp. J-088 TaxID=2836664 RepID=UPI001FBB2F1F|nr:hypothetical protein [Methylobacterium sp. J-088]MCJ2062476.1 hypothetical protein [Methylobacterium sp. J-088]
MTGTGGLRTAGFGNSGRVGGVETRGVIGNRGVIGSSGPAGRGFGGRHAGRGYGHGLGYGLAGVGLGLGVEYGLGGFGDDSFNTEHGYGAYDSASCGTYGSGY